MSQILELPAGVQLPEEAVSELNARLLWIGHQLDLLRSVEVSTVQPVLSGKRSDRTGLDQYASMNQPAGTEFYETDTGLTYLNRSSSGGNARQWYYMAGIWTGAFAGLPTLSQVDAGLLFRAADKNRTLRWSGSGWQFAPWEVIPIGFIAGFRSDPGAGWHICDGSTVQELHTDGTLHAVTLENFTTAAYPKWGSVADGAQPAVVPGVTGAVGSTTAAVQSGTGTTVVTTVSNGTLGVDGTGEPRHYDLVAYQRI